jgi:hypothetical protein
MANNKVKRGKSQSQEKQMRRRPAIGAASFVDLYVLPPAARSGETTVLVRQRSQGVPLLPSTGRRCAILRITSLQPLQ